jgi:hypothetical protein
VKPTQTAGGDVAAAGVGHADEDRTLPVTGFAAWILAIVGALWLLSGLALRRAVIA